MNLGQKVYFHKLGEAQDQDVLVHEEPEHPEWGFLPSVTEDGKYLVITVWQGTDDRYRILYRDLNDTDKKMKVLVNDFEQEYSFVGNEGSLLYFQVGSQRSQEMHCYDRFETNSATTKENWTVIVPESEQSMESAGIVGDSLIVEYLKDAKTQVKLFDLQGKFIREVEFPGIGSAGGFGGKRGDTETFYSFSSFNRPPSVYRYDLKSGESKLIREAKVDFQS